MILVLLFFTAHHPTTYSLKKTVFWKQKAEINKRVYFDSKTTVTSDLTVTTEDIILCNAIYGDITITIPTASNSKNQIYIKKIDSTSNEIKVTGDDIDGEDEVIIMNQYDCLKIVDVGSEWSIV